MEQIYMYRYEVISNIYIYTLTPISISICRYIAYTYKHIHTFLYAKRKTTRPGEKYPQDAPICAKRYVRTVTSGRIK